MDEETMPNILLIMFSSTVGQILRGLSLCQGGGKKKKKDIVDICETVRVLENVRREYIFSSCTEH